jgi:hypothetical protein
MNSPWLWITALWLMTLLLAGLLWQRFTRVPSPPGGLRAPTGTVTRRVLPLWLVIVLIVLIGIAVWLTLRWGAPLWSGGSGAR